MILHYMEFGLFVLYIVHWEFEIESASANILMNIELVYT